MVNGKKNGVVRKVIGFPAAVLKPVRDYLVNEQRRLQERRKRLKEEDPFTDTDRTNDNAAVDTEVAELAGHERIFAIKREVDKALINVRKALTRIKLGRYGVCNNCGRMIDTDRLAINPTAEYCVDCERSLEKKSR